jgi:hypothetical protein
MDYLIQVINRMRKSRGRKTEEGSLRGRDHIHCLLQGEK